MLTPLQTDQVIHLKKLKEILFDTTISTVTPTPTGEWIVNFRDTPQVVLLDKNLDIVWERDYQAQDRAYSHTNLAYNSINGQISLSGKDFIKIRDPDGKEIFSLIHMPWDSGYDSTNHFTTDGNYFISIIPSKEKKHDLLQIRNTKDFSIIEELKILNQGSFYSFQDTDKPNRLLIQLSREQDDGFVYELVIQPGGSRFEELPMCFDRIVWNLSKDKSEFITAPHYEGAIISYSLDTKKALRKVEKNKVFKEDDTTEYFHWDGFGFIVKYLSIEKIAIVISKTGRLLLLDVDIKKLIGEIIPEGYNINGYNNIGKDTMFPSEVSSYQGNAFNFWETQEGNLMIHHGGHKLALYDMTNLQKVINRPKTLSLF